MTNAEKFIEVFGTDLKRQYSTKTWWVQEFVPNKTSPTGWIPVSVIEDIKTEIENNSFTNRDGTEVVDCLVVYMTISKYLD